MLKNLKNNKLLIVMIIVSLLFVLTGARSIGSLDGNMLSKAEFAQLVKAAKKVSPPKNGKNYVFGYANMSREITFSVRVEEGLLANAKQAGIKLLVADNRLDGATALQNAESFIRQHVDFVIEFQTDANFGPVIMKKLNDKNIQAIAIDIPMEGSIFFGANNPKSGFMGGAFIAQQALSKWDKKYINKGYLVVGALPQSGAIPAMRTGGQIAGFLSVVKGFPKSHVIEIDTKGSLQGGYAAMNNVLGRIPKGVPIMGISINDQTLIGMMRATKQANKDKDAIFVGMGMDEIETMASDEKFLASVGYFPENYGSYIMPMALKLLAKEKVPPAVLVKHIMVTKGNVCKFYPKTPCKKDKGLSNYKFPQREFEKHLKDIQKNPDYKDLKDLVPTK